MAVWGIDFMDSSISNNDRCHAVKQLLRFRQAIHAGHGDAVVGDQQEAVPEPPSATESPAADTQKKQETNGGDEAAAKSEGKPAGRLLPWDPAAPADTDDPELRAALAYADFLRRVHPLTEAYYRETSIGRERIVLDMSATRCVPLAAGKSWNSTPAMVSFGVKCRYAASALRCQDSSAGM